VTLRIAALAAVVVVTSAGTVGSAGATTSAFRVCGTVKAGGATWSVVGAGVACSAANPLVRKLAAKPHPSVATRLGTYLGLKCVEFTGKGKREIACVSTNGRRSVYGVTPPKAK
jgi:hypothetical protein